MANRSVLTQYKSGIKHPNWNGGSCVVGGYQKVMTEKGEYTLFHVIIMEWFLGRKLEGCECVHHCNKNRADNRLENLELMLKAEHSRLHGKETFSREDVREKAAAVRKKKLVKEAHSCWKQNITLLTINKALSEFKTQKEAARSLGICADTLRARLNYYKKETSKC